ncbi:hypothetical protein E2C01_065012 [Portunus trituberculatus]|uniref:Uncharacterized protein n=1 Tax=Portunus trituberculatus TaxID=210409 RepID=A0A5B7HMC5_PORTR|nr:hypothetical protein [Portunus trituberculatus]
MSHARARSTAVYASTPTSTRINTKPNQPAGVKVVVVVVVVNNKFQFALFFFSQYNEFRP